MDYHIDPSLFDKLFVVFRSFVEQKSKMPFRSFPANQYTNEQEDYKREICSAAGKALSIGKWKPEDVGTGRIVKRVVQAIQLPKNNLLPWQPRWGDGARPHRLILDALTDITRAKAVESCIYAIYRTEDDEQSFAKAVEIFGGKYSLLAYLFFIKDRSKYLPIATKPFDFIFPILGAEFKTKLCCSWRNYVAFLALMAELKGMLAEALDHAEVSLLDAHSFAWMLAWLIKAKGLPEEVSAYLKLGATEREAITKARIGQGQFRDNLIEYWSTCAVTGCTVPELVEASHIRPWAKATDLERVDPYNGLLLSPTLHRCFDQHFITFSDTGQVLISGRLSAIDREALGVDADMKLKKLDDRHKPYLEYHRKQFAKKEKAGCMSEIGKLGLSRVA